MNSVYKIILIACSFLHILQTHPWQPSPENTFFAFDIDDVLVQPSAFQKVNLVAGGVWHNPLNSHNYIASLIKIKNCYTRDKDGKKENLLDKDGNSINGLSFHFLYHGMRDINLASYVPWIVNTIETSRTPIYGTVELCQHLKNKGYVIVFATNKDRASYDFFEKSIGGCVTTLPEQVFLAHPANNEKIVNKIKHFAQLRHVPPAYKRFAYQTLVTQPTDRIKHVPHTKPHTAYYEYVHLTVKKEKKKKNMVFIDDKETNINGVKEYNTHITENDSQAIGIPFKNPYQLTQKLVQLGVLSEEGDKKFIKKMKQYQ